MGDCHPSTMPDSHERTMLRLWETLSNIPRSRMWNEHYHQFIIAPSSSPCSSVETHAQETVFHKRLQHGSFPWSAVLHKQFQHGSFLWGHSFRKRLLQCKFSSGPQVLPGTCSLCLHRVRVSLGHTHLLRHWAPPKAAGGSL